ncbi:hypothetical protein BpHYR1_046999 [Brachionus plicatilis]|uniref:Uncharacterized protein n=1 Tax=Brachionus plicatilis TaxID=10195 RepID=A0A3M7SDF1_BRAPC|nr:hypothetical protein BpHYR1_046999 [Brachionus plicatilis]
MEHKISLKNYGLEVKINEQLIPIDPFPTYNIQINDQIYIRLQLRYISILVSQLQKKDYKNYKIKY